SETPAAASAPATTGCAVSRRIHPIAPVAAPPVTRVCHLSHVRVLPWPSSVQPSSAWNAVRIRDLAAVCIEMTCSSARRQSASSAVVSDPRSAAVRKPSPALIADSASPAVAGGAGGWPGRYIALGLPLGGGLRCWVLAPARSLVRLYRTGLTILDPVANTEAKFLRQLPAARRSSCQRVSSGTPIVIDRGAGRPCGSATWTMPRT